MVDDYDNPDERPGCGCFLMGLGAVLMVAATAAVLFMAVYRIAFYGH